MTTRRGHVIAFAGSYAAADERGLRAFRVDADTWGIREVGGWTGVANPSFLAVSAAGDRLYAVGETAAADGEPGSVHAFAVTWSDHVPDLTPIGRTDSGGDHPCHLAIDPAGEWIAVANYGSGTVTLIELDDDGRLGPVRSSLALHGGSVHPERQRGPHAHSATPTPDGRHLLVADLGGDRFLSLDPTDETLAGRGAAEVRAGSGPRHSAVRAADRLVVLANELDSTLSAYQLDDDGGFTLRSTISTLPRDAPDNLVAHVVLTADGRTVFVSNRGHDTIASAVVGDDGTLATPTWRPCGGSWPRHFALLPGDDHLLVANERSDTLAIIDLDGRRVTASAMPAPTCVVVRTPSSSS